MSIFRAFLAQLRRRRRRANRRTDETLEPYIPSFRRLEARRVLDVGATFTSATGQLDVFITNSTDSANVAVNGGEIVVTDAQNQPVAINVDGAGAQPVSASDVTSLRASGDAAGGQELTIHSPLALRDGLTVDPAIERAILRAAITSVESGMVRSDAAETELHSRISTIGQPIVFGGNVVLAGDAILESTGIEFEGRVDSAANFSQSLTIDAGLGEAVFNDDIGGSVPLRGLTIRRADGGLIFGGADVRTGRGGGPVTEVNSLDAILIGTPDRPIIGGIVFNAGPDQTLAIATTGDDVVTYGAGILESNLSIDTGSGPGDIIFRLVGLDSQQGESNSLFLRAGQGSVLFSFTEIGTNEPLEDLIVHQADGGVIFGESDGTQGTGQGPVQTVRVNGNIDLGVGDAEIGGTGIVFNAGPVGGLLDSRFTMTSLAGSIRLNGSVLLDSLFVDIDSQGDIVFTNDTPIDSRRKTGQLTLRSIAGMIAINEDIGRNQPLGSLVILSAPQGLLVGGSTNESPGSGTSGPVELINVLGSVQFGRESVIGGAGIVLSGSAIAGQTLITNGGVVRMNGPVSLATDVSIQTNNADVFFSNASTIDSAAGRIGSLTIDAGSARVRFNNDLGATRSVGSLVIVRADGGVWFGNQDPQSPDASQLGLVNAIHLDQEMNVGIVGNIIFGGIYFSGDSSGVVITTTDDDVRMNGPVFLRSDVRIDTGDGRGDVLFTSAATVDSSDGQGATTRDKRFDLIIDAGIGNVRFNTSIGNTQPLDEFIVARAASIVLGEADVSVPAGAGPVALVQADGRIDFGAGGSLENVIGSIVLNGGPSGLSMATLSGDIRLNGPTILESSVSFNVQRGAGSLIFTPAASLDSATAELNSIHVNLPQGDAIFGGPIGTQFRLGTLTVRFAQDVLFGSSVIARQILVQQATQDISFGGRIETDHPTQPGIDLTATNVTFHGPVLTTGQGSLWIGHAGLLDIRPGADMRLDGEFRATSLGSTTRLGASIATSGDRILFNGRVELTDGHRVLSTVAGGFAQGAEIVFADAVTGQSSGAGDLLLNAGTGGIVLFDENVGDPIPVGTITVVSALDVSFSDRLAAARFVQLEGSGTTTFAGNVLLDHPLLPAIDVVATTVVFRNSVTTNGEGTVLLTVSESLDLRDAADFNLNGSFRQSGGGSVKTTANIVARGEFLSFDGPVTLASSVRFQLNIADGQIRFGNTLDGSLAFQQGLQLVAEGADIIFVGDVGSVVPLQSIAIVTAKDVVLTGDGIVGRFIQSGGTGRTHLQGTLTATELGGGLNITNDAITVDGGLQGGDNEIRLSAADQIVINSSVDTEDGDVTIAGGGDVIFGSEGKVATRSGRIDVSAGGDDIGELFMADGSMFETVQGTINVLAGGSITIGRLVSPQWTIRLTSRLGGIIDGGDSDGPNIESPALVLNTSTGVGAENSIETRILKLAATNSGSGGIRISNQRTDLLVIGTVDQLAGLTDFGSGEIEILNNGPVTVAEPVFNRGGGHTTLRSLNGDLLVEKPIQNTGGDGFVLLYSGANLDIQDSLDEPPPNLANNIDAAIDHEDYFEILALGEGGIRFEAVGQITVANGEEDYAILRTRTGQFTNVPPIVTVETIDQGGSDIDAQGRGIVKVTLGDDLHPEINYQVTINWGDGEIEHFPIPGTINPLRDQFKGNLETQFASGNGKPGEYFFLHKYFGNPNIIDPSAPIPIRVEVRFDPRTTGNAAIDANRPATGSGAFNGIRLFESVTQEVLTSQSDSFTLPGIGGLGFIKIIESTIVPVEARLPPPDAPVRAAVPFAGTTGLTFEVVTTDFEDESEEAYRVFMQVVDDVTGAVSEDIPLPISVLDDPIALFRRTRFPNGHYRIYLEEVGTKRLRLLLDVHIYNGRVVPPDFREGAAERPAGAEPALPNVQPMIDQER